MVVDQKSSSPLVPPVSRLASPDCIAGRPSPQHCPVSLGPGLRLRAESVSPVTLGPGWAQPVEREERAHRRGLVPSSTWWHRPVSAQLSAWPSWLWFQPSGFLNIEKFSLICYLFTQDIKISKWVTSLIKVTVVKLSDFKVCIGIWDAEESGDAEYNNYVDQTPGLSRCSVCHCSKNDSCSVQCCRRRSYYTGHREGESSLRSNSRGMFKFATKSEIARELEIWSGFREQSSHLVCEEEGQCQSNAQMLINVILTVRCPWCVMCS